MRSFLVLIITISCILSFNTIIAQPSASLNAQQVVEAFFEVTGGIDKWKNLKTFQSAGSYGVEGEASFYTHYDYEKAVIKHESEKISSLYTKEGLWLKKPNRDWQDVGKYFLRAGKDLSVTFLRGLPKAHISVYLHRVYSDNPDAFQIASNPIEGDALIAIKVKETENQNQETTTFYVLFDPSTKLLSKSVRVDEEGDIISIVSCRDYQEVDGYKIAFEEVTSPQKAIAENAGFFIPSEMEVKRRVYTQFKFNETIPAEVFEID